MEQLKIVKKQLVLDLDKNEAPTAWRWRIDRFVRFGDGQEKIISDEIPATPEEVSAHVGAAVARQASDIEADRVKYGETIAALTSDRDKLIAALTSANERLALIAQADAAYDAQVKPVLSA